jgi:hypothetical protein
MSKLKIYPTGVLRYSMKTNIPNMLTKFAGLYSSLLPKNIQVPMKVKLIAMPSHKALLPKISNSPVAKFPEIDILIPFHPKDVSLLIFCLTNVVRNSINPVGTVRIVTTPLGMPIVEKELKALREDEIFQNVRIDVIDENEFLPSTIMDACRSLGEGSGWLIKQSIFFWNAVKNRVNPTVVIDSDTLIIQRILWIDGASRSNVFANFHENDLSDYFIKMFPNVLRVEKDFGFVSHFVLVKPQVVLEFLLQVEQSEILQGPTAQLASGEVDLEIRLAKLLATLIQKCMFNFCDFDFYAKAALKIEPEKTLICKWSNVALDVNEKVDDVMLQHFLRKNQSNYLSVSVHTFSLTFSGSTRTQEIIESRLKAEETTK